MRAGRLWLQWTGPGASVPESRTPGVDCRGRFWQSSESNWIESNRLICGTESNRIESFSFLPNRPSLVNMERNSCSVCFRRHTSTTQNNKLLFFTSISYATYCIIYSFEGNVKIEADINDISEHPHDDKPRPYVCMMCDKCYTSKVGLNVHKRKHTVEKSCSCTLCEKQFPNKHYLKLHMVIHSDKYMCTECGKCFRNKPQLTVHRRSHSGEKLFECHICRKRFTRSDSLHDHSRIHSGEKPYKCHLCDKAFIRSGKLSAHMRVHMGDKPYKCSLCNKCFGYTGDLQRHKRCVHSNRRLYECPYCGRKLKTNWKLTRHVRGHTGAKPYSCRHCSESFARPDELKTHLLKSHNEGTWFTCHICPKKFTQSAILKAHLLRHEGVKPYVCSECQKRFYTAGELREHEPKHSDFKRFCCGRCSKTFRSKYSCIHHFNRCSEDLPLVFF